jgi:AraC family transcriptional regulator
MEPRIETLTEKKLVGNRLTMSISNDRTRELWQGFMPRRKKILNVLSPDLFCMQLYYNSLDFKDFTPDTRFEKWAAVEVSDFSQVPPDMHCYTLQSGLYAVFTYKGASSDFGDTFRYIFGVWLPNSEYELDKRAHFEILGDKYINDDPSSEEEVWIPIKRKQ